MADWDRLLASAPLNREAAIVTGESREPAGFRGCKSDQDSYLQDGPHPVKQTLPNSPSFKDLTGQRFGKLVVRGVVEGSKSDGKSKGSLWAVRCDCSRYTARRQKFLLQGDPDRHACVECDYAAEVKAGKVPSLKEREELRRVKYG
jgi:hypothetical protein